MCDERVCLEGILEAFNVCVTTLTPAVCGSIGGVAHLELGDRRFGVRDVGLHRKLNSGTAITKRTPLWARSFNWVRTSSAMFQGKMST
jgi:hypothetical protein